MYAPEDDEDFRTANILHDCPNVGSSAFTTTLYPLELLDEAATRPAYAPPGGGGADVSATRILYAVSSTPTQINLTGQF